MSPRWQAMLVTAIIFVLGGVAGIAADRVWQGRSPAVAEAATLTPEGMDAALGLDAAQQARVRAVLDSLRADVARAAQAGPDSLRNVARRGRQRLEDALPADRRVPFQQWMQQHHARMMREMGGGMRQGGPGMGRMMGPGGMGRMMRSGASRRDTAGGMRP